MRNRTHRIFRFLMMLLAIILLHQESYGQKNVKKKNKVLSEEEIYQSDFYFIEAEKFYLIEDFAKALDMFSRSLEINNQNSAAHYKIAEIYMLDDKFLDALPHALKAIEIDPDNKYYYLLNAKLSIELGDYPSAAANYEELFKRFDGNDDYLFDLANIYEYIDESEKAIAIYDRIEHIYGQYLQITQQKEKIYLKLKQTENAQGEWLKLVEFSPSVEHYKGYINFLNNQGKFDKATEMLNKAIEENPDDNSLLLLHARSKFEKGDIDKSLELLKIPFADRSMSPYDKVSSLVKYLPNLQEGTATTDKILSLCNILAETHTDDYSVLSLIGDINYQLKKVDEALVYYLRAIQKDETKFEVWQNILVIETQLGKYESVIKHAEKAKEIFPNQALLYFYEGSTYLIQKQYKEAAYEMERGVRYARKNPNLLTVLYGQLGDAYNATGNYQKSDASYEKALEIDSENDYALNNYSYYLSLRGEKLDKAEVMSASLIERYPDNFSYLDTYAWVLYKSGKLKEAKKILEKAIKLNGVDGIIIEHYGDVLFNLGRKEEALAQWQKAKDVGRASDLIDKKIADRKLYE